MKTISLPDGREMSRMPAHSSDTFFWLAAVLSARWRRGSADAPLFVADAQLPRAALFVTYAQRGYVIDRAHVASSPKWPCPPMKRRSRSWRDGSCSEAKASSAGSVQRGSRGPFRPRNFDRPSWLEAGCSCGRDREISRRSVVRPRASSTPEGPAYRHLSAGRTSRTAPKLRSDDDRSAPGRCRPDHSSRRW